MIKVYFNEIMYIEARKDNLMVHLRNRSSITYMTMKAMEELLPVSQFIRVHRSYIIAKDKIVAVAPLFVEIKETQIPIGKKF